MIAPATSRVLLYCDQPRDHNVHALDFPPSPATAYGVPFHPLPPQGKPLIPDWATSSTTTTWSGIYGRLDPQGHFPTITTVVSPTRKV